MKTAVVIPTLNAEKRGLWLQVLEAVAVQTLPIDRKIVIDSDSCDQTCAAAERFGWECRKIRRQDFNHGLTRDAAVRELAAEGFDTVIFLSQDVVPAAPDALAQLTTFLWDHPVAGCCGKQRAQKESSLNGWQRSRCYPDESAVKSLDDLPALGMMTPFFSNAFAAWKTAEVIRYGGFPETGFGEDMLFAAKVLNQQGAVGYCAQAVAVHEHSNSLHDLFLRGMQVGAFHRRHPELRRQFGRRLAGSPQPVPCGLWFPLAVKAMGFVFGYLRGF